MQIIYGNDKSFSVLFEFHFLILIISEIPSSTVVVSLRLHPCDIPADAAYKIENEFFDWFSP